MKVDSFLILVFAAAASALYPGKRSFAPPFSCCFTLHDASTGQIVRQTEPNGYLTFSDGDPEGWYCINLSDPDKLLWDDFNNTCFIDPAEAFQCLDPIPSGDVWSLQDATEGVLIAVDGKTDFYACGEGIYAGDKRDKGGCRVLKLKVSGLQGSCGSFRG